MGRLRPGTGLRRQPVPQLPLPEGAGGFQVGRAANGWQPQYLLAEADDGTLQGAVPLYVKGHSQGEYVFDHGWAQAFERAGSRYIPSSSRRALHAGAGAAPVRPARAVRGRGPRRHDRHAGQDHGDNRISSVHATFCTEADWKRFGEHGWLQRLGQQYHWHNDGYRTLRRLPGGPCLTQAQGDPQGTRSGATRGPDRAGAERRRHQARITGTPSSPSIWTPAAASGARPISRATFFDILGSTMADKVVLVMAEADGRPDRRRAQPQGRRHALRPLLGLPGEPRLPAFRGVLLPGDRLRDHARPAAGRGRRAGRSQDPARLRAGAGLSAHSGSRSGFRRAIGGCSRRERPSSGQEIEGLNQYLAVQKKETIAGIAAAG